MLLGGNVSRRQRPWQQRTKKALKKLTNLAFPLGFAALFPTRTSTALSLFQQQSCLFVILTLCTTKELTRSTRHHGLGCLLVAVQEFPFHCGFEFPSLPLVATPPHGPVDDWALGFPLAMFP